jgi:hypothetical protein
MKFLRNKFVIYPYLFGIYPVLALMAHNAREMDLISGLRALLGSLILTFIINVIYLLLVRSPLKSALLTSYTLLLFYSYGHINLLMRDLNLFGLELGRHRYLLPGYLLIWVLGAWLILRTRRNLSGSTRVINAFAVILLFFPLYQLTASQVEQYQAGQRKVQLPEAPSPISISQEEMPPDVYYLILDGYPRGDFINQHLGSSNLAFLDQLQEMGFFVAHCSQSNYTDTRFSVASTLNMQYLDDGKGIPEVVYTGATLDSMIKSGKVQQIFSDLGYTNITFESGFKWLRWEVADHRLQVNQAGSDAIRLLGLNGFELLLLETSGARFLLDLPLLMDSERAATLVDLIENPRAAHRARVIFNLEQIPQIPATFPSPKFVYAHLIFPHPPFVVDAEGNPLKNSPADELAAYADQITYLNQRLLVIIDQILENSEIPPVIILQGDHGATIAYEDLEIDPALRLGILNAYYFPPAEDLAGTPERTQELLLYPSITPVNTFRLVFDQYFNSQYGLLEDLSIIGRQSPYTKLTCTMPR